MKTVGRIFVMVIGVMIGVLVAVWLANDRRIPTLRVSHTLGKGSEVSIDWIQIR
ncbi:MAG: hypothetical protein Kow00124_29470 [Anaerolineae bacterium]